MGATLTGARIMTKQLQPKALIAPVTLACCAVLAALAFHRNPKQPEPMMDVIVVYGFAALPHFLSLVAVVQRNAAFKAYMAGFLSVFWVLLGLYLLFVGLFLFGTPSPPQYYEWAWFGAFGLSVWMVVAGLATAKHPRLPRDKPGDHHCGEQW